MKIYALYKGEEFIDIGTVHELAERRGVKIESIYWLASPAAHRRDRGNMITAVCVDEESEDEGVAMDA